MKTEVVYQWLVLDKQNKAQLSDIFQKRSEAVADMPAAPGGKRWIKTLVTIYEEVADG